jgi:hypothetical protein
MAKGDQTQRPRDATLTPEPSQAAEPKQGTYGSGGSYGVGGGFDDDDESRDTVPEDPDERVARAARAEAQQEGQQVEGFEREVDEHAPRPPFRDAARTPEQEELAAKKQRGSRV